MIIVMMMTLRLTMINDPNDDGDFRVEGTFG
jgi:hypothetical protein